MAEINPKTAWAKVYRLFPQNIQPILMGTMCQAFGWGNFCGQPDADAILPQLEEFCKDLVSTKIPIKSGYSVEFAPIFELGIRDLHRGLHLVVKDAEGRQVGALSLKICFPMEIHFVQGGKGNGPREFYQKTGRHFDVTLVDALIDLVSKHINVRGQGKQPRAKIIFTNDAILWMPRKSLNRLVGRYCTREAIKFVGRDGKGLYKRAHSKFPKPDFLRIRGKFPGRKHPA